MIVLYWNIACPMWINKSTKKFVFCCDESYLLFTFAIPFEKAQYKRFPFNNNKDIFFIDS